MLSFKLSNSKNHDERYICFINCVLQFLAAIPVIRRFFINRTYRQPGAKCSRISSEITRIFNMADSPSVTSAGALRQDVGSLPGNNFVKDGEQQDACDFLQALIKALDEEIGCEETRNSVIHNPLCVIRSIEGKESFENRITKSEDGTCPICGHRMRNTEEDFRILHLSNKKLKAASLQELLDENLGQPSSKFEYKCNCGVMHDVEAWRSISKLPPVLLINVPKFEAETRSVVTDEFLVLNNVQYQLVAVMDHIGRFKNRGHWITWSRCPDVPSGWIRCDDTCIEAVELERVFSRNNHTFAYVKVPEPVILDSKPASPVNLTPTSSPPTKKPKLHQQKITTITDTCFACGKSFKRLMTHLKKSQNCQLLYDMGALEEEQKNKRKESHKEAVMKCVNKTPEKKDKERKRIQEAVKRSRENMSPGKKDLIRKKNKAEQIESREAQTPEKKDILRKKNKDDHAKARIAQTPEKKDILRKKNKEDHTKARMAQTPEKKDLIRKKNKEEQVKSRKAQTPEKKGIIRKKDKEAHEIFREEMTPEKKEIIRKKNKEEQVKSRKAQTPEKKGIIRKKDKEAHEIFREEMTPEKKEIIRKKDKEAHEVRRRELQNDPAYKKSLATYMADYRQKKFKKCNESIFGRHRIFIENVRFGPSFPCISCHRLMFNISVIQVDLEKFRKDVNDVHENVFEETIHFKTPSNRNQYYICFTCKNYIFKGQKSPMSAMNCLEVFDNKDTPELQLTELEASMIAKTLFFLKIFKLPRSAMSALKSRCVCIPIGEADIQNTLSMLPRTPNQAGLVPVKLKRMKKWKNVHLQQYVNVEKLLKALTRLRDLGHKYYQFPFEKDVQSYQERCLKEDKDGYDVMYEESDDETSGVADDVDDDSKIDDSTHRDDDLKECVNDEVDKSNMSSSDSDNDQKKDRSKAEEVRDEILEREDDEEYFLKHDAVGKFMFNYNKTTAMSNDLPEMEAPDAPVTISPGEGKVPISQLMDTEWDMKGFAFLDPTGENNMNNDEREVRLTNLQFVEQRLLNVNDTFARCQSFLYACLAHIENLQLTSRINMSVQRGSKRKKADGGYEYGLQDAFQLFDTISNSIRYWSKKKLELFAKVENLGVFHIFWTLSCADYRFNENFTSFLKDEKISYNFNDGQEEVLINGVSVEDYLSKNSSKHEYIKNNILTATRNFNHRVKTFVKTIIMNKFNPMNVLYYNYRVEFQMRGSPHIHGVLFLNIPKIVEDQVKEGKVHFEPLERAFATCSESKVPDEEESLAIVAFVDKFITCSLRNPMTRKIAMSVQSHHHTFTCTKRSSTCRFAFPRFPCLYTQVAVPVRLIFREDEEKKKKEMQKMRTVLQKVREVLEDKESMQEVNKIHEDDIDEMFRENELYLKAHHILEDHIFRKQIEDYNGNADLGQKLVDNLQSFREEHEANFKLLERKDQSYRKDRLLKVLHFAKIEKYLEIDEDLDQEEKDLQLIVEYHKLLTYSVKGFTVNLKRDTDECFINNFNHEFLFNWNANMDVSCVFDFFAILTYVSDYYMKPDNNMLEFLLAALKEHDDLSLHEKLKLMKDVFLNHREIGESECYYRLLPQMHLAESNISSVFLHTGFNKSRFLRKIDDEEDDGIDTVTIEGRDGKFVEGSSLHDKYLKRPQDLFYMSYAQFAKCYSPASQIKQDEEEMNEFEKGDEPEDEVLEKSAAVEVLENGIESDFIIHHDLDKRKPLKPYVTLVGKFYKGEPKFMRLRKRRLVIRYHKFKRLDETHEYMFSEMELYYIFKNSEERKKCQEDNEFCHRLYYDNRNSIKYVKSKVMPYLNHVEEGIDNAEQLVDDSEIGVQLDAENQQQNDDDEMEVVRVGDDGVAEFDYDKLTSDASTAPMDRLFKRVEVWDTDLLMAKTRQLDDDQLFVVNTLVDYVKKYKTAVLCNNPVPEPVYLKVFGSAGTGKSFIISLLSQWVELLLRKEGNNPDCPHVIRTSFTGSAASAIEGQTLHSSFALNFSGASESLDDKKRDKMRHILKNLRVVILDEFSMVKVDTLYQIDVRLREIKGISKPFGGVSLVLLGDPLQLRPVRGSYPWEEPKHEKYRRVHQIEPIWRKFLPVILRTNHRQGSDHDFSVILNKIRTGQQEQSDFDVLSSRVFKREDRMIPEDSVHIFATNAEVNQWNQVFLERLAGVEFSVETTVIHPVLKNFRVDIDPSGFIHNTSLLKTFNFKINSKVMLTTNLCTVDGLTNGAFGTIVGVRKDGKDKIIEIHVCFSNQNVGKETAKQHPDLEKMYGRPTIPIKRFEAVFGIGKRDTQATRSTASAFGYPLKLASCVTSHKVQGQTIKQPTAVVVDLRYARNEAQVYVMLSRAQSLSQIYIIDKLYEEKWRASRSGLKEFDSGLENAINVDKQDQNKQFEILSLNILSLRKHIQDLQKTCQNKSFNCLCLQETWLPQNDDAALYEIRDIIPHLNSVGRGRGIATYCSEDFVLRGEFIGEPDCQLMKISCEKFDIVNVYRSQECKVFKEKIEYVVDPLRPTILTGDTNIDISKDSGKHFLEFMKHLGFTQLVKYPTHDQGGLLDHVYVTQDLLERVSVSQTGIYFSDHQLITIKVNDY